MDCSPSTPATDISVWPPGPPAASAVSSVSAVPRLRRPWRHTTIDEVTYKIAQTREERESAFRLVYDAYAKSGLMDANAYRMRVTPYHLRPTTDVFIATHRDKVIYTLTLISDDFDGVPMQSIYEDAINERREQGLYLAEVSCLASRQDYFSYHHMLGVFVQLLGLGYQYCRQNGIDRVVIAIHPRHFRFYKRCLGVEKIGNQRDYASVRNHPAVAGEHDFARMDVKRYPLYDKIYGCRFQRWELLRQPMLEDDREYFRPAAEQCDSYAPVFAA